MKRLIAVLGPVVVLVIVALVVLQVVHGGSAPAAPVAQASAVAGGAPDGPAVNGPAGDGQEVSGTDGAARVTVGSPQVRPLDCQPSAAEKGGGDYLIVKVTVAVERGTWRVDPYDFLYMRRQGEGFTASTAVLSIGDGCGSDLPSRTVDAGESVSGTVYFHSGATPGDVTYRARSSGQQKLISFPIAAG
jgi:hypothetical protein